MRLSMLWIGKMKNRGGAENQETVAKIVSLLKETVGSRSVAMEIDGKTRLAEIGIESIHYLKLLLKLEKNFALRLEDFVEKFDLSSMKTVSDIADLIHKMRS